MTVWANELKKIVAKGNKNLRFLQQLLCRLRSRVGETIRSYLGPGITNNASAAAESELSITAAQESGKRWYLPWKNSNGRSWLATP